MNVLSLNAGSSSLKCAVHDVNDGGARALLTRSFDFSGTVDAAREAAAAAGADVRARGLPIYACVHRLVFGGEIEEPTIVTEAVRRRMDELVSLDPLHAPQALAVLDFVTSEFAGALQVACFDTMFFRDLPAIARALPVPGNDPLLRRYGFHGLSYEHVVTTLGSDLRERAVVAHLGSGSSLAALASGKPIDTSMGFSPLGGVIMSSRPGDLDPGVLLYLGERHAVATPQMRAMLESESGLRALAGGEGNVRVLSQRAAGGDARAAFAVECYVRSVAKAAAALTAVLGGLDMLIFTGGIGEHQAEVRTRIARSLAHLGAFAVLVIAADENLVMARHAHRLLAM